MKIAILGTNGFLSNNLCEYFGRLNYELNLHGLHAPLNQTYSSYTVIDLIKDEVDYSSLIENDIIIYTIGGGIQSNSKESVDLIFNLNLFSPIKICHSLKDKEYQGIFITFGSYFEIGYNQIDKEYSELDVLHSDLPISNDYSLSKRLLSRFMSSFKAKFTTWHFILPTIYGESEEMHRLIPYTLNSIKNHMVPQFTTGDQIRQYIYINDISEIINKSIQNNIESGIYNVSGAETFSVKEIVYILYNLMGENVPDSVFGSANRSDIGMKILKLDGSILYNKLNFAPATSIREIYMKYI